MPELPDVELYRRHLDAHALQREIAGVVVGDARILGDLAPATLIARLIGNRLEASRRHGKHLLVRLARDGWLTYHFGMTGRLAVVEAGADDPPYDRVRLDFADGGHLAYLDRRLLGRVGLTEDAESFVRAHDLGPDALDPALDAAAFAALMGGRREVKAVLMDQALIAGIGNLYADEILFQARLHPKTPAERLDGAARVRLFEQTRAVLATAIACGAGAEQFLERLPAGHLLPARAADGPCPRCTTPLVTTKVAGRTSYFCPACQPASGGRRR